MNGATNVIQVFQMYNGDTWLFALFLAAAAYLLFQKGSAYRFYGVLALLAACLFLFNQAVFWLLEKILGSAETYYRFLWMIPVVPVLAYAAVDVIAARKKRYQKLLAAAAAAAAVVLAGAPYLDAESFSLPTQVRYLNTDAVEVCRLINEDRGTAFPDQETVTVACPIELMMSLRLQEPAFRNAIRREIYLYDGKNPPKSKINKRQWWLLRMVNGKKIPVKTIQKVLKKADVQYVVMTNQYNREQRMKRAGCTLIARMDRYNIYRAPQ